jgi:hypothetical protein
MEVIVLLILAALACCLLMSIFRPVPKPGPRPRKPPRRIPARSGHIKRKAVALRYRDPTPDQIAFAAKCRLENLMQSSGAQPTMALCAALNALGVRYEREVVTWFDGDRFVISDFVLPDLKISIEADGSQHRLETERDADKAAIVLGQRGLRTIRFWNRDLVRPGLQDRLRKVLLGAR